MEADRRLEGFARRMGRLERELNDLRSTVLERLTPGPWQTPTLLNSWVNTGGAWTPARYRHEPGGVVRLEGLIQNGTTTSGTDLFVIAAGFRPATGHRTTQYSNTADDSVAVFIQSDGTVQISGTAGTLIGLNTTFAVL